MDTVKYIDAIESVRVKNWAAGSKEKLNEKMIIIDKSDTLEVQNIDVIPALYKIFDEPIVNSLDHIVKCIATDNVTNITVNFHPNGDFEITNDGKGFNIGINKSASEKLGRTIWGPTLAMGILFQGTNLLAKGIIGGTNGIGAKLPNCFSDKFKIITSDGKKIFEQTWSNNMRNEQQPIFVDSKDGKQFTTLKFSPSYENDFNVNISDYWGTLDKILYTRCVYANVYAKHIITASIDEHGVKKPKAQDVTVKYNNKMIDINDISDISSKLGDYTNFKLIGQSEQFNNLLWDVSVVYVKGYDLSIVNGIFVSSGTHMKYIMKQITTHTQSVFSKKYGNSMKITATKITQSISLLMCIQIPAPSWSGQTKESLKSDSRRFSFIIPKKQLDEIANNIISIIGSTNNTVRKEKIDYDKYTSARLAGTKHSKDCSLLAVEGDSAMSQVSLAVSDNKQLGFDNYGIISLGGVIMNVRKACVVNKLGENKIIKQSNKLKNNIFMKVLMSVLGLDYSYDYDPANSNYAKQRSNMRYGCIVAVVDQDMDGKGNILSLLLNVFDMFWPNLIKSGYIKWFPTPIIRAYPANGGKVYEFYNVNDYDEWSKTTIVKHKANYYKGLGTHSSDETISMFKKFNSTVRTYNYDNDSSKLFEIYFGKNPDSRKIELSGPTLECPLEILKQQTITGIISCSDHLKYEARLYQKDNIERKLDHIIDGQNQAGRKVLDSLLKIYVNQSQNMKIAALAGYISQTSGYHHGEASLCNTLTIKGFIDVGGKQLPLLLPASNFGSRKEGGNDAAQPRYIQGKLNKPITQLLFPVEDYQLLDFHTDEGKRTEPMYFVPIIPLSIIESTEVPSHGWKIKIWNRDALSVINNVKKLIFKEDATLLPMPPCTHKWKGKIVYTPQEYSVGTYVVNKNKIIITELPLRVWNGPYIRKLNAKKDGIILSARDYSDKTNIRIELTMVDNWKEQIKQTDEDYFDYIEIYLGLRKKMQSHLNYIGTQGEVIELNNYEEVIHHWFPIRKHYYKLRIDRIIVILSLKICMMENIIKYITNKTMMNMMKLKDMELYLEHNGYTKLWHTKIKDPEFIPTNDIVNVVTNSRESNYDYLIGLSDRNKSDESLVLYYNKLTKLKTKKQDIENKSNLGRFPGAAIWLQELDELAKTIKFGRQTNWTYDDHNKYQL